jgi:tetratricopeptide (TPR) repeat protein
MLLHQVLVEDAPSPRKLNGNVPKDLETICLKCLEKAPDKRFQSAAAFRDDLRCFLRGEPVQARPVGRVSRVLRWCRRQPVVAGLITAIFLLMLSLIITFQVLYHVASQEAATSKYLLLSARGEVHASNREWKNAIEDYWSALQLPIDTTERHRLAYEYLHPLLLRQQDHERFLQLCHMMLEFSQNTEDFKVAERTAKTCLLYRIDLPDDDKRQAIALAQLAAEQAPSLIKRKRLNPNMLAPSELVKGIAEYRVGEFESAIRWLDNSLNDFGESDWEQMGRGTALAFLAMAHGQNGELAEWQRLLDDADALMQLFVDRYGSAHQDIIMWHAIRAEAESFGASVGN